MLANRSMPPGTIIPVISYPDVREAARWLCNAFGFVERLRVADHRIQLRLGDASIIVSLGVIRDEMRGAAHATHNLMVRIDDVDSHYLQAKSAGAVILHEPQIFPYGEKQYSAEDPGGHVWVFSQSVADVDPADWGGELVGP
jgi:uncharacterized glyoxalase superfamily protein PhnB